MATGQVRERTTPSAMRGTTMALTKPASAIESWVWAAKQYSFSEIEKVVGVYDAHGETEVFGRPSRIPVCISEKVLEEQKPDDREQHQQRFAGGQPVNIGVRLQALAASAHSPRQPQAMPRRAASEAGVPSRSWRSRPRRSIVKTNQLAILLTSSRTRSQGGKATKGEKAIANAQHEIHAGDNEQDRFCRD